MLSLVALLFLISFLNAAPTYNSLGELIKNEYSPISSTLTTPITIATAINQLEPGKEIKQNISRTNWHEDKLLAGFIFLALSVMVALCRLLKKFYMNNGHCKMAWFMPKKPSEYQRRRDVAQRNNSIPTSLLVSMEDWSKNDIIIDINKGFSLRRIGTYSSTFVEEIVHTFIPLSNFCVISPKTDVCLYASLATKTNVVSLAKIMTSRHMIQTLSSHSSESVSRLIDKDLSRVLSHHHPDDIIRNTKSMVHFVNNEFHYQKNEKNLPTTTHTSNTIDNYSGITHLAATPIDLILKQIISNEIGFQYMSNTELKLFLSAIFTTIDISSTIYNIQESLDAFLHFIVGQSIFALRSCSLSQQNSLSSQPCLAISTLFLRIPPATTSIFSIYRLIPLPIIQNGDMYIYSNLPKIIGINFIDHTLLIWKEETDTKQCIFSTFVQCQTIPVSIALSKSTCLSELFYDTQSSTDTCQVLRSKNIAQDIIKIDDGIWLFSNVRYAQHCQVYSTANDLAESITIIEPSIINLPCNKKVSCMDSQLPASHCSQRRVIVTPHFPLHVRSQARFIIPIQNMSRAIINSYQSQNEKMINGLMTAMQLKKPRFKQLFEDVFVYIIAVLTFILFGILLSLIKWIKYKLQREINSIESLIEEIITV
ncbi:unnamed protein product [Rotaria magnacalcarata]|uniref:Envelope protein n=4 Tax=Rotaria magnacalcarata TaxID=392030 RepID=A0A815BVL4_9BILA|nr:unnamed protein product [Rotaria magnacalcarata]CAF4295891.1 unnamed protein product [Rotaria magnacalcarata]